MVLLHETLLNTFLSARFVGTDAGCTSGVVLSDGAYQQSHTTTFDHMLAPLAAYNPKIKFSKGALGADEQKWSEKLTNQSIIQATNQMAHECILHFVEDT